MSIKNFHAFHAREDAKLAEKLHELDERGMERKEIPTQEPKQQEIEL